MNEQIEDLIQSILTIIKDVKASVPKMDDVMKKELIDQLREIDRDLDGWQFIIPPP